MFRNSIKSWLRDCLEKLQRRISPGSLAAYAFATSCIGVATILRLAIGLEFDSVSPFPTFYVAAFFAALIGGVGPGVFAAVSGTAIAWWAFVPPYFTFLPIPPGQQYNLLAFLFASLIIVWGADQLRSLKKQLRGEENTRKLLADELAHRLKNKIATIQSIISLQLRDQPEIRLNLLRRLQALTATDDLILATQGKGAHLHDILSTELGPYSISRISLEGPNVFLPPKIALTMALLFHELATNAAKYGALSTPAGCLSVSWSLLSAAELSLEWRESGGPAVAPPSHRGFGTSLVSRALHQIDGDAGINFERSGVICKMTLALGKSAPSIVPTPSQTERPLVRV